jgi:hypothetical protein
MLRAHNVMMPDGDPKRPPPVPLDIPALRKMAETQCESSRMGLRPLMEQRERSDPGARAQQHHQARAVI